MYTCGPTVYQSATIGNFRTYTMSDLVRRCLEANGYEVTHIMNITDVGHLVGDNLGDASTGRDRLELAAEKESKSAWDIANFYHKKFIEDYNALRLHQPEHLVIATEHIPEQIKLVQQLEEKGYTYQISDGIYFDTSKFPEYGKLSNLTEIREGARVEPNPEKRNPRDFALWKFSPKETQRQMEWESPWGKGFPGWHIECSAMSMKYLGSSFDLHLGGEDLRSTHHPNEIAQSEAATGKTFVKYWMHPAFLMVDGHRMGKSLGNAYTVDDIVTHGFDPVALKYFYYAGHYRTPINFTWEAMEGAQRAYDKLRAFVTEHDGTDGVVQTNWWQSFLDALNNDLNTSVALSVIWDFLKQKEVSDADKVVTLRSFDTILGLGLDDVKEESADIADDIKQLISQREAARLSKDWKQADILRQHIEEAGYTLKDTNDGPVVAPSKKT